MDMTGEHRIPASRDAVWEALNDPEVLKACIPGCDELEMTGENTMRADMTAKVGPVKSRFKVNITIENQKPPESYTLSGEGQGGAAGFAKGGADVTLIEEGDETVLRYSANMQIGGKLAQVGSRLVQGTANKLAGNFFTSFAEHLQS